MNRAQCFPFLAKFIIFVSNLNKEQEARIMPEHYRVDFSVYFIGVLVYILKHLAVILNFRDWDNISHLVILEIYYCKYQLYG